MRTQLKFLQDYADATDNIWLLKKLKMLEYEIEIESMEQSLRGVKNDKTI